MSEDEDEDEDEDGESDEEKAEFWRRVERWDDEHAMDPEMVYPGGGDRANLSAFWRIGPGRKWRLPQRRPDDDAGSPGKQLDQS